jgi:methionyl-tRNA formyltransferase
MADALRIIFAGTPEFAAQPLQALCEQGILPVAVLTQPDRPAGRGKLPTASAVKTVAQAAQLPVLQPQTLKDAAIQQTLRALQPDLMIVIAYGLILPPEVLAIPRLGCVNVHASLLPRWRGAAPIQRAIQAGDTETGLTVMLMDAGLDTGPMLRRETVPIPPDWTAQQLHDALAQRGGPLLEAFLQDPEADLSAATPQPSSGATYADKLTKAEAQLNWQQPAEFLARTVRAFNAWPVAWFEWQGERIRVWAAQAQGGQHAEPGRVAKPSADQVWIATAKGWLELLVVQPPGGQPMSCAQWCRGRGQALQAGEVIR